MKHEDIAFDCWFAGVHCGNTLDWARSQLY